MQWGCKYLLYVPAHEKLKKCLKESTKQGANVVLCQYLAARLIDDEKFCAGLSVWGLRYTKVISWTVGFRVWGESTKDSRDSYAMIFFLSVHTLGLNQADEDVPPL